MTSINRCTLEIYSKNLCYALQVTWEVKIELIAVGIIYDIINNNNKCNIIIIIADNKQPCSYMTPRALAIEKVCDNSIDWLRKTIK